MAAGCQSSGAQSGTRSAERAVEWPGRREGQVGGLYGALFRRPAGRGANARPGGAGAVPERRRGRCGRGRRQSGRRTGPAVALPDGRPVLCAAAEDRPGEFGGDRPGGHQRLYRRRRLSGAGHRLDGNEPRRGAARDRDQRLAGTRRRRVSVGPEMVDGRQNAGRPKIRHLQRGRRGSRRVHGPGGARVGSASRAGGHGHRGLRGGRQQGLHLHPGGIPAGHRSLEDRDSAGDAQGVAGFEYLRNAVQFRDRTAAGRRSIRLRRGNGLDGVRGRGTGPAQPAAAVSGGSRAVGLSRP